jgi:formylglycine-generating enzyme required for sulfatase activity
MAGLALVVVIAGFMVFQSKQTESPQTVEPVAEPAEVTSVESHPEPQSTEPKQQSAVVGAATSESPKDAATRKPGDIFRDTLKDGSPGPEMVVIPPGSFRMGSEDGADDEKPVHEVKIVKAFSIGKYEVTFEEYDQFAADTGRELPGDMGWGRGKRPVINVSWDDAVAYAQWLSKKVKVEKGKDYRLPTEAEWEYAARAGTQTRYWWGDDAGKGQANCNGCGSQWDGKQTAQVGSFPVNPFGLHDTAGNVWEWAEDCYHENYKGVPADGAAWEEKNCGRRVIRGGSWLYNPEFLRSANRLRNVPDNRTNLLGFRLAQDL